MVDVTDATFEQAVVERSREVPVVVDLWAEWCGPCRTLGPIIERVIDETDGRVELAKVDVDANPAVAQAFKVQGIPAVYALRDGAVVDGFVGAQPEQMVREFVAKLDVAAPPSALEEAAASGDEATIRAALAEAPDHPGLVVALAELMVADGRDAEALAELAKIPETAEVRRVAAAARTGHSTATDEVATELDALLDQVRHDDEARQRFVDLLEVLGADDPRTADYRRRLTAAIY